MLQYFKVKLSKKKWEGGSPEATSNRQSRQSGGENEVRELRQPAVVSRHDTAVSDESDGSRRLASAKRLNYLSSPASLAKPGVQSLASFADQVELFGRKKISARLFGCHQRPDAVFT